MGHVSTVLNIMFLLFQGMLEAAGGFGYAIGPPIGGILYAVSPEA